MRLAILGTGDVGRALASGLHRHGHDVTLGTRDPRAGRLDDWLAEHPGVGLAPFADAARDADALVLAVGWNAAKAVCDAVRPHAAGKLLVDVTNPLDASRGMPPGLAVSGDDSAGETVQRWLREARVVKCWNIVGNPYMVDPELPGGPPTMFIAGDDADAKRTVLDLLKEVGWSDAVDLGGIGNSRYLEGLAMVWIRTYFATGSGTHAFKLLRAG